MKHNYINTSQNVQLDYSLADVGNRVLAYLLDLFFLISYGILAFLLMMALGMRLDSYSYNGLEYWWAFIFLGLYFPMFCYSLWAPFFMNGQTFGKKIMQIRIIRLDGREAGFGTYFVRWLLNIVDFGLAGAWLGLVVMVTSDKRQRVADMVAKTIVISTRKDVILAPSEEPVQNYEPQFKQVLQLTDKDIQIIKTALEGAKMRQDHELVKEIREKVESVIYEYRTEMSNIQYLETVLKDYQYFSEQ